MHTRKKLIALAIAALSTGTAQAQSAFTPMGDLAGGGFSSTAYGVSGDGSVVVGSSDIGNAWEAFRWTQAGGMVGLGDLPNGSFYSFAYGVSSDGSVVVGSGNGSNGTEAFRWTSAGMVGLGDLPEGNAYSIAYGVSGDGSVVVGLGYSITGQEAFRWTSAGMVGLGDLPEGTFSSVAYGVNSDGSVVVGRGTSLSGNEAFRWTSAGMVGLGDLPGSTFNSAAYGVSGDGSVVVGYGYSLSGREAFRWTSAGMVGLGDLTGSTFNSAARGVSSDGSVVVGYGTTISGNEAFRWTAATGMQRVADWLTAAGVTVAPGYMMETAYGVSADGSVVVGSSSGPSGTEAFIARVSAIGSGAITLSNLQTSLGATATGGAMTLSTASTLLNGAHSRPLSRRVAAGQKAFWLAGDWGRDDHGSRDGDLGLAEAGLGYNFGPAQLNVSLGQTWAKQALVLGGQSKTDGTYLLAEALIPVAGNLWATVGGYGHWGDADLKRGYLNAGTPDRSTGTPDTDTWGLRARLDWENARRVAGADFSPYIDLTYSEAKLDAYTETGGGFPARFDARRDKATELRVGVNAVKPISGGDMRLLGMLEAAHRFENTGARTSGQVIGLFGFDLAGQKNKRDWLRVGAGVEGKLAEGTAALSLNVTTKGEVPNAWLAASWQMAF
ncbi:MAG: autotransporter domain-containing protein [Rhodocyclaceae bacterium]|nr:autotransporter domain-containing protein [Rhodocyclaceae bacterium]